MAEPVLYVFAEGDREDAVLVRGTRIAAVGRASRLARRSAGARRVHLRGRMRPAALDGHIHLVEYGLSLGEADLSDCDAAEAAERLLRQPRSGDWVLGRGARVAVLRALSRDRELLQRLSPLRIWAHDFHTALTDLGTLQDLGLWQREDPPGGAIGRDADGTPTGMLHETAALPLAQLARADLPARRAAAREAIRRLHRLGIVGAVTFESLEGQAAVQAATDELPFRAYVFRMLSGLGAEEGPRRLGPRAELLGVKEFLDGTLGSRTAWMRRPYADTGGMGEPRFAPGELSGQLAAAAGRGFAVALHAIGDRAAAEAVDLLEAMPAGVVPHRIEHLQILERGLEQRIAAAGIAASVQPCHLLLDAAEARSAWSDRIAESYPYLRLLRAGTWLAFGSDAPVERPDPGLGVRAAMDAGELLGDGRQGMGPDAAYRCYAEGVYGSLGRVGGRMSPGMRADLALYPRPPEEGGLPTLVLSEGQIVHEEPAAYVDAADR